MILELHREGVSVSDIARRAGLDRKTVRKYIARGLEAPAYSPRPPRPLLIDGFASYLDHGDDSRQILTQERLCPDAEATLTPRYCGACDLDKSAENHRGL